MPLKEVKIPETEAFDDFGPANQTVRYVESLENPQDYFDLTGKNSNYVFVEIFSRDGSTGYWFADARRHLEVKQAMESQIGKTDHQIPGQLLPSEVDKKIRTLVFHIMPGENQREVSTHLEGLFSLIHPSLLQERVIITWEFEKINAIFWAQNNRLEFRV